MLTSATRTRQRRPWPPEAFGLWFKHARVDMHLPVYSALFTGQRKETVLNMLRPKSDANEIRVYAQKIKSWIPTHKLFGGFTDIELFVSGRHSDALLIQHARLARDREVTGRSAAPPVLLEVGSEAVRHSRGF
jgi:hypothetical protein